MYKYIAIFAVVFCSFNAMAQETVTCTYLRDEEGDIDYTFVKCGEDIFVNTNTYNF